MVRQLIGNLSKGFASLFQDFWKWVAAAIIGLVLTAIYSLFGIDLPEKDGSIDYIAAAKLVGLETIAILRIPFAETYEWFTENWLVALIFIPFAVFGWAQFWKYYNLYRNQTKINKARNDLLGNTGLLGVWANADRTERAEEWDKFSSNILEAPQKELVYAGANGWDTFGHNRAPLFGTLEKFGGPVRIILLKPDSDGMNSRANNIDTPSAQYRKHLRKTIRRLEDLRDDKKKIQLGFIEDLPRWKIIATRARVWLQHYEHGHDVEKCPVYIILEEAPSSLYHAFRQDFEEMWDACEKHDFKTPLIHSDNVDASGDTTAINV